MKDPITKIKEVCNGRWDSVIRDLTGFDGKPTICPKHGGNSGKAFYGAKGGKYAQLGITWCNTCGCNNDGINSIGFITGKSLPEVVKLLTEYVGGTDIKPLAITQPKPEAKAFDRKALYNMYALIKNSADIGQAKQYLVNRGIKDLDEAYYADLRFLPNAFHYENNEKQTHNALIGIMRHHEKLDKVKNVQRIFLTDDFKKADIAEPKKLMASPCEGYMNGSAVWLKPKVNPNPATLHVCEGIETGLSVLAQSPIDAEMACCLTATNLSNFEVPKTIKTLYIWADNDESQVGLEKAKLLRDKAKEQGIDALILLPKSGDWNDHQGDCARAWKYLLSK